MDKKCAQNSLLRPKLHFDATKRHVEQYMSMKTMLLATYSAYFTSVASENVGPKGPEGDKLIAKSGTKGVTEAETAK